LGVVLIEALSLQVAASYYDRFAMIQQLNATPWWLQPTHRPAQAE